MSEGATDLTIDASRPDLRTPQRVRHPAARRRALTVQHVESLTPQMKRVTFGGDLDDFVSLGFDDHIKLFFPDGTSDAEGAPNTVGRDFTPRRYDPSARTLAIDFALHEAGPATQWAVSRAKPGAPLTIGGPRGSFVIPTGFDWHLLIGDDTALPAIARRLEELPAGTRAAAVIEVGDPSARIEFTTQAELHLVWCYRGEADTQGGTRGAALLQAVRDTWLPENGEGYVWAAGEAATMRAVRQHLCGERGVHKTRIRAASYWKQGAVAVHETLDD
jgi:NADPH-dependent ferric siderophore reductase